MNAIPHKYSIPNRPIAKEYNILQVNCLPKYCTRVTQVLSVVVFLIMVEGTFKKLFTSKCERFFEMVQYL